MSESAFVQHILTSIRNELNMLKSHNYIQPQAYDDILRLLPTDGSCNGRRDVASPFMGFPAPSLGDAMPSPLSSMASPPTAAPAPAPAPATAISPPPYNAPSMENKLGKAEALYDYNGENPSDLTLRRGDIIQLTELINDDWWKGSLNGKTGIFPRNYVKRLEPFISEKKLNPPATPVRNQQHDSYNYSPVPPKQDSYNYPPPPSSYSPAPPQQMQSGGYAPPPQQNIYAPPFAQSNSYAPPPAQNQVSSYAPPPVQQVASTSAAEEPHKESKLAGIGKQVASAATWGFGATRKFLVSCELINLTY
ncbi:hypothetical protein [Parasitella parasitica]|uniref:SH3 domain-containing protein n=1 Tax=Parasitella parasitica TaxID=35722 RepID=A0A0B7NKS0_9FUNG|nr:hypothetical protein [Parasitella parasitica]